MMNTQDTGKTTARWLPTQEAMLFVLFWLGYFMAISLAIFKFWPWITPA